MVQYTTHAYLCHLTIHSSTVPLPSNIGIITCWDHPELLAHQHFESQQTLIFKYPINPKYTLNLGLHHKTSRDGHGGSKC